MELIIHLLEHALEDTLYLVPFLFVTYVLLEALEHKAGNKAAHLIQKAGKAGPAVGALLGAVPQCGFSAAGSALYASRAITLGTLFAVLLSTSDEMLPLFIAAQVDASVMFAILGMKVVIGMIMGFTVDALLRLRVHRMNKKQRAALQLSDLAAHENYHQHAHPHSHDHHHDGCNEHHHDHRSHMISADGISEDSYDVCTDDACACHEQSTWAEVLVCALKHTLQVSVIVYLISLALVAVLEIAGEEAIASLLANNPGIAIAASALVGLIPNCGASVVICELYLDGMLSMGAMMSGLLVSAGVGLLVLFSENRNVKQNLIILLGLFVTGVVWGLLLELSGISFM